MKNNIIEVDGVTKQYRIPRKEELPWKKVVSWFHPTYDIVNAVDSVSFQVTEGEIIGLLGRNGAGKSTTIKMLTGILYPDGGSIRVGGIEPYKKKKENAWQMGVVFGQRTQLWWDIPVIDTFQLLKTLYKIPEEQYKDRMNLFTDLFTMEEYINRPVRQLSLGQRICADLCAALLHNPKIIYLDEPTIGLDFLNKENIRNFIKTVNQEYHTTVLITSHDLQDIEELCSRYLVIDHGQLVCSQSIHEGDTIESTLRHLYHAV